MNFVEQILIPGGMLIMGSALTWIVTNKAAKAKAAADTQTRIAALETRLSVVQQEVLPMSAAFQAILIKELTHFHTPVMDALLVKLGPPNTLTEAEEEELAAALQQRSKDLNGRIDWKERDAAMMLPLIVKRARAEETLASSTQKLQVVALPDDPEPAGKEEDDKI